jgi:hypothetical protein
MTTRKPASPRPSLFPRTASEAAQDAVKAAARLRARADGETAVASLTEAGRAAEARYPALCRAARRALPPSAFYVTEAPCLGPDLPSAEGYGCAHAFELGWGE